MITGSTGNEGALYLTQEKELTLQKYQTFFNSRFGLNAAKAMEMFPASRQEEVGPAIDKAITVGANAWPARLVAKAIAEKREKAYLYHFTRIPQTALARRAGAHHGVDLAYVFGNMKDADGYDEIDRDLSRIMMQYWVNFAKTGDPNGAGLPAWPQYQTADDLNLEFGDRLNINQHLFLKEIEFINQISGWSNSKR